MCKIVFSLNHLAHTFGTRGHQCPTLKTHTVLGEVLLCISSRSLGKHSLSPFLTKKKSRVRMNQKQISCFHHNVPAKTPQRSFIDLLCYYVNVWSAVHRQVGHQSQTQITLDTNQVCALWGNIGARAKVTNKSRSRFRLV